MSNLNKNNEDNPFSALESVLMDANESVTPKVVGMLNSDRKETAKALFGGAGIYYTGTGLINDDFISISIGLYAVYRTFFPRKTPHTDSTLDNMFLIGRSIIGGGVILNGLATFGNIAMYFDNQTPNYLLDAYKSALSTIGNAMLLSAYYIRKKDFKKSNS